jgi:hypothetical protein
MLKETTIKLSTPLKLNDVEAPITEVHLKEPTAGQMMKVQNYSGFEQNVQLVAAVSGIVPLLVQQMSFSDFRKCVAFLEECFRGDDPAE